jgi:hypothetical protein
LSARVTLVVQIAERLVVRSCARRARGLRHARMRGIPSARDRRGWPLFNPFLSMLLVPGSNGSALPSESDV